MKSKSKWFIFDKKGKKVQTKVIVHPDGRHYIQMEAFEKELKEKGLYAHRSISFDSRNPKWDRMSFKEKLMNLGWEFDQDGNVVADW